MRGRRNDGENKGGGVSWTTYNRHVPGFARRWHKPETEIEQSMKLARLVSAGKEQLYCMFFFYTKSTITTFS